MEDQTTEKVGNTYEDKLVQDRKGLDVTMPDVEVVSNEPQEQVQEKVAEESQQEEYRTPSEITAEGNEEQIDYATDWEQESRKFQSMYDKQKAEFDALSSQIKPLQQLQSVLESRPDVVQALQQQLEGKPAQNNETKSQDNIVDENSFDPWEAYYKPDSPSYKLRVEKEKALVNEAVSEQMAGIQSQVAMQNLKTELKGKYGMNDDKEVDDFINFAMTPRDQLPVDFLINVYRQFYNKGENAPSSENIQAVTETQAMPRSAGVLQGGEPNVKSELDVSWDRILKAGNAGRLL